MVKGMIYQKMGEHNYENLMNKINSGYCKKLKENEGTRTMLKEIEQILRQNQTKIKNSSSQSRRK